MKPWADVEQSTEFQSLSDQDKSRAQSEYFDDVVVPQLDQRDIEPARDEFFTQFKRSYLPKDSGQSQESSAVNQAVQAISKVGTGLVEGPARFGSSYIRDLNPVGWAAHLGIPGAQSLVNAYASVPEAIAGGADTAQKYVEENVPVNPLYADTMPVKVAGVIGQAAGQLATVLTGAAWTKAPRVLQAIGLGQAGAMGIDSGYEEADRLGVTNPWQRDLLALTYAASEAGVEGMGGMGSQSFMKRLTGEIRDTMLPSLARGAKTALSEGAEEPITGTLQDLASNAFAAEDPNRPGYAMNGQPLPSLDLTQSDFWKKRGEEFALGTLGGTVFAGAEFAGSRPKIEEAKKLQQKAQLTIAAMEQKPDLTPDEQQDLQDLQQHEANLSTFIQAAEDTSQTASAVDPPEMIDAEADPDVAMTAAVIAEEPTTTETDEIEAEIQPEPIEPVLEPATAEVADSGLTGSEAAVEPTGDLPTLTQEVTQPEAERITSNAVPIESAAEVGSYPSGGQSLGRQEEGQGMGPSDQREIPADQGKETAVAPTEAQIEEAWLASPEFTQAEELAAAGDIEAAEALETAFREKQALARQTPESAPQRTETAIPEVPVARETSVQPIGRTVAPPPVPEGLDPYWADLGKSQTYTEGDVRSELRETSPAERTQLQGVLGAADNSPQTLAKALKTFQPRTGGKGSTYKTERQTAARRDAVDEQLDREEGIVRSRRRSMRSGRVLYSGVTKESADTAKKALLNLLPTARGAWIGTSKEVKDVPGLRQSFIQSARLRDPSLSLEDADERFDQFADSLPDSRMEGFTVGGRQYVLIDGVGVTEGDGSPERAVRRVMIHEDAHEAVEAAIESDPALKQEWENIKREISAEDLDSLAASRYPWMKGWRDSTEIHNDLAHEWIAEQMEILEKSGEPPQGLLKRIMDFFRKILARFMGEPVTDVTDQRVIDFIEAGRAARSRDRRMDNPVRPSQQNIYPEDFGVPEMPEGSASLITHESPYPGMTSEKIAEYAWPRFFAAWNSHRADPDGPLTPSEKAQLEADWKANLADENSMEIAAGNAFSEERMSRASWDVYDSGPFSTPAEDSGRNLRMSMQPVSREQDADYMRAVESGDMETAQRMVDEAAKAAGYTEKVYHGTPSKEFTTFQKTTGSGAWYGEGVYVSRSPQGAKHYAGSNGRVVEGWAKVSNPKPLLSKEEMSSEAAKAFTQKAKREGHDSVEVTGRDESANEVVLFDVNQIKSSDPVTRDAQGNVIPLSQRFNQRVSDIRYSMQPSYSSQSEERESDYKEAAAAMPESGREYVQFLGSLTRTPKVAQAVRPMVDYARSLMGSYQGDEIEVSAENTERVKDLAAQAFQKGKPGSQFAEDISEQFRQSGFSNNGQHQGSVMAGVLQMEILDYAVRLAGEGDRSLALALMPYANDVAAADHASLSNAGRALQMRSMAGQQKGFWTILNSLAKGERELAEKNPIYKELREALFSDEVKAETAAAVEKDMDSAEAQKAFTEDTTPENLLDAYLGRALGIMDQAERDITIKLFTDMAELEVLLAKQEAMQAPADVKASMQAARGMNDPVAIQQRIDELKSSISKGLKALDKFKTSEATKETRKKALNKTPKAKKAMSADADAKKMLERLENKDKRTKKEPAPWKKTYTDQIQNPKPEAEFATEMTSAGISPETATKLYEEAKKATREIQDAKDEAERRKADRKETQAAVSEAKERVREQKRDMDRPGKIADQKRFINEVMRQIFGGTLEEQADPNWRRMVMVNAFKKAGFSQGSAENATDYLGDSLDRNLRQAQEKAAQKAAKDLKMKKPTLEKLVKAIRSRAVDPLNTDPVTKALAEEAGFAGITPAQFTELAKLDGQMRGPYQSQRAKAAARMLDIALAAKPPKSKAEILTQAWISSALSSISTMSLSAVHAGFIPARRLVTDFAGIAMDVTTGKTKPADAAQLMVNTLSNLQEAARNMLATAKFAGVNDAYTQHIVEFINQMHSMQADLQRAVQTIKDPNASGAKKGMAAIKIAFTSTDIVRRILSTADETWGSMLQDYILRNEAMRTLVQKGGLTPTAATMLFTAASNEGRIAAEKHLNETGNQVEAQLIARDATQNALLQAVRVAAGEQAAEDVGTTANLESPMELGNRRAEDAPLWDIANTGLEWVKQLAIATRRKNELLGRMITGFVTVPANVLNRSASFTPLGIARALYKMKGDPTKTAKFYEETMKTEGQQRMRLIEGITGTLLITALLALTGGDDDEGLVITGSGPEDKGLREAWMKKGNQPNRIEWKNKKGDVLWSVPYARGGFDHLNLPFTLVGTMDDMRLKGIKPKPANVEWGTQYMHTALKGLFDQAKFFGLKNVASMPTQNLTDKSLASQAAYLAAPVLPWSGLTKSLGRMWTGPTDQSSVRSAILAQLPVTNFYATPALNALGDQRGPAPTDSRWEKSAMSGNPFLALSENKGPDADLYSMMIERGVAPNVPLRSNLERVNGFLTDAKWEQYLKTRGALIKQGIRKNLRQFKLLPHKDAQNLMERISADSTRAAKDRLGLE